jgi:phasin
MATALKSRAAKTAATKSAEEAEVATQATKDMMESAFGYPKFEVPEIVRSFAEQGLKQTREVYARAKTAAEEATDLLEDSLETGRKNIREAQFKALDMAKSNTDATFELARELLTATSVTDVMQLQAAFARERFQAFVEYSRDVQDMLSRTGIEAAKPAKAMMEKSLAAAKAA